MFNLINIGERAGSGIPNIYSVWHTQGWQEPTITESFAPERITLTLSVGKKPTEKTDRKNPTEKTRPKKPTEKTRLQRERIVDYLTVIGTATLASIGTAGIPGVGLITLTMVFQSVGLPVEAIALIMGIDRILDMSRTAVNITGDAVCTTIIAAQGNVVDREKFYGEQEETLSK